MMESSPIRLVALTKAVSVPSGIVITWITTAATPMCITSSYSSSRSSLPSATLFFTGMRATVSCFFSESLAVFIAPFIFSCTWVGTPGKGTSSGTRMMGMSPSSWRRLKFMPLGSLLEKMFTLIVFFFIVCILCL